MVKAGQKYGALTAISPCDTARDGHIIWRCKCDCGTMCTRQSNNLQNQTHFPNCGCIHYTKHGGRNTREYQQWQGAKARCYQTTNKDYGTYGARGILMCDRWKHSFENFAEDMGQCPIGLSLGRIDNNGDYEPSNCRWETRSQQQQNRTTCYTWYVKGHTFNTMEEAAKFFSVSGTTIVRWCEGSFDSRRGSYTHRLSNCHRELRYG